MHTQTEQESNFSGNWGNLDGGSMNNLVVLACVLKATTIKGRQLFGGRI